MSYIGRALAPKSCGFTPATASTSPLARMDQRWNLPGRSEALLSAGLPPDDDGFVDLDAEVLGASDSSFAAAVESSQEHDFLPSAPVVADSDELQMRLPTVAPSGRALAAPLSNRPWVPVFDTSNEPLHRSRKAGVTQSENPHVEFATQPAPTNQTQVQRAVPSERRDQSEFRSSDADLLTRVATWVEGHEPASAASSLPARVNQESGRETSNPSPTQQPASLRSSVSHATLEIGNIEIEIIPAPPPPSQKAVAVDAGRPRVEHWPSPFGGRQF